MQKGNIEVRSDLCTSCLSCQLICSLQYAGTFNPLAAYIVIKPGQISFTEDCIAACHLCTNYCAYGALVYQKNSR